MVIRPFTQPGGYDFYKVMKKLASELAHGKISLIGAEKEIAKIVQDPERKHTLEAIRKFSEWLKKQDATWVAPPKGSFKSKTEALIVRLEPELAFIKDGQMHALYLWNLDKPNLKNDIAGEGLRLLVRELNKAGSKHRFGIFNLRTMKILDESVVTPASDIQLRFDLFVVETIWHDLHDPTLTPEQVVSHISTLGPPPPSPPP